MPGSSPFTTTSSNIPGPPRHYLQGTICKALSERLGTALVNGNGLVRRLQALAGQAVPMHGHRHIDWIGKCAGLAIVSASSPVKEATDDADTYFYIHALAARTAGQPGLSTRERWYLASKAPKPGTIATSERTDPLSRR